MAEDYRISDERVAEIAQLAGLTEEMVADICTSDWSEGDEHQTWLDNAPAAEIASWAAIIARDIESDPDRS